MKQYKNDYTEKIAFPLGGIGTGNISISGNGMLVDPEINGHPDREKECGVTNFAVKAEYNGKIIDGRIIAGNYIHDIMGTLGGRYGQGNMPLSGFKHFRNCVFNGEFPFAVLDFTDDVFPAEITLEAFNPFIPSDDKNSSLPAAFFNLTIKNISDKKIKYTVLQTASNLLKNGGLNSRYENNGIKAIVFNGSSKHNPDDNMIIATDADNVRYQEAWFRGGWFDSKTMFMNELNTTEPLTERSYSEEKENGMGDAATVSVSVELEVGESRNLRFLIAWYVPAFTANASGHMVLNEDKHIVNYYSTLFGSSAEVAEYCFKNWSSLYSDTKAFADSLYSSTLPEVVKDAIQGNIAILKSTTCHRLEDGSFWGWEGVHRNSGSCDGTCEHVWNYAYAMPFLFPKLEKGIRSNEFKYNISEDGMMYFRMSIALEKTNWLGRSCVDGQMGCVIKSYREWKLSGDDEWLRENWCHIKKCIEFAWNEHNFDRWDPEKKGVITGRQHHTLDVEMFGAYAWLTGFYHAALLAGAEIAEYLGEEDTAKEYREIFERGKRELDTTFNGSYYEQRVDINDRSLLEPFNASGYWNPEVEQIKYQICNGCGIDQVLADWHTELIGLPNVFVPEHRKKALESIYRYNFVAMHDNHNPCRVFACNDEKGVTMFRWPDISEKPKIPVPYSEECMSGFEYAVADNMLQCGMENEALKIVSAIRDRYDGKKRNPWAEIECGASYSRAMASYSFLLTYSGFIFDMPKKQLGFKPLKNGKYFWSVDGAWGTVTCCENEYNFEVLFGNIELHGFITAFESISNVMLNETPVDFDAESGTAKLNCCLGKGASLRLFR